jgi:hypothetical protein
MESWPYAEVSKRFIDLRNCGLETILHNFVPKAFLASVPAHNQFLDYFYAFCVGFSGGLSD